MIRVVLLTGLALITCAAVMLTSTSDFPAYVALYPAIGSATVFEKGQSRIHKNMARTPSPISEFEVPPASTAMSAIFQTPVVTEPISRERGSVGEPERDSKTAPPRSVTVSLTKLTAADTPVPA